MAQIVLQSARPSRQCPRETQVGDLARGWGYPTRLRSTMRFAKGYPRDWTPWGLLRREACKGSPVYQGYFILFFCLSSSGWRNIKLKLTTLPRIFTYAVYQFNSIAFAIQR